MYFQLNSRCIGTGQFSKIRSSIKSIAVKKNSHINAAHVVHADRPTVQCEGS